MFIRKVIKTSKNPLKSYEYFRLTHAYRIGDKNRQIVVLNLGTLEGLPLEKHKALADRIEEIVTGINSLFPYDDTQVENLAQKFSKQILKNGTFPFKPQKRNNSQSTDIEYVEVNLESAEEIESRDLGGEWLAKQAFERLELDDILSATAMGSKEIVMSKALLTAKMIHPSSELETERWLVENTATMALYDDSPNRVSRYQLYKAATMLYDHKEQIEKKIYEQCRNLFSQRSKVIIFDLTNMHFEGMMAGSTRAKFGRSKQKRSDCRLISGAMSIDSLGFVRGSQFWDGNVSEPQTLQAMLSYIGSQFNIKEEKPLVVIDAGITTEANLKEISKQFDYVCVSRSIPSKYTKLCEQATQLQDNQGNKIKVTKVETSEAETMLMVMSELKEKKETSIRSKLSERFEEALKYLKEGLAQPRRIKKIEKVHEQVGKLRQKFSRAAKYYEITYVEDRQKGVMTDITWKIKEDIDKKPRGEYFLRYSKNNLTDQEIWDAYNLIREVEASFRCLKSDLNIRPIFHQLDKYIEPHIWLGIMAYQVVTYIRNILKDQEINYSWKTIVEKLKTQRMTTTTIDVKGGKKAVLKTCTQPNEDVKKIYAALNFKPTPFDRKTKVVTQI